MHKYIYAHDNPVNFTDPTGLFVGSPTEMSTAQKGQIELATQQSVRVTATLQTFQKVSSTTIKIIEAIARAYTTAQEVVVGLARQFEVPILVYGSDAGGVTSHIADAIFFSGNTSDNQSGEALQSKFISPVLNRKRGRWPRFYGNLPVATKRPPGTSVDEYPYATSVQGGRENYRDGLVSLRAVPVSDQQRQSTILGRFYIFGEVSPNGLADPMSYFVNFAAPTVGRTFMIDRVGSKIDL